MTKAGNTFPVNAVMTWSTELQQISWPGRGKEVGLSRWSTDRDIIHSVGLRSSSWSSPEMKAHVFLNGELTSCGNVGHGGLTLSVLLFE